MAMRRVLAGLVLLVLVVGTPALPQEEAAAAEAAAAEAAAAEPAAAEPAAEETAAAEGAPAAEGAAEKDACGPCPSVSTQHYTAKGCTPVMNPAVDPCCPSHYECETEEARGIPMTSCLYDGKTYEVGADVPVPGPCRRGCQCKKSIDPEDPAKIECAIVECPVAFSPLQPNCRPLFSNDECCEVSQECSEIVTEEEVVADTEAVLRSADCFSEGLEYYTGDKIFFEKAPCQQCICGPEFSGPDGPGCTTIDCGLQYRDRHYLRDGCTPLYVDNTCCPADWICPGSPSLIYDASTVTTEPVDETANCVLGEVSAPRGEALKTYDCHVSCQCITPPDFTCVQYTSCPMAVAAQNEQAAP